jgi:anti-anti-sigma factor
MRITEVHPGTELVLVGRLDSRTIPEVRSAVNRAVETGSGDLVLDVAALEVWDAGGLGMLVAAQHRAGARGRRLVLRQPSERLRRLVRATRLQRVLSTA